MNEVTIANAHDVVIIFAFILGIFLIRSYRDRN